MDQFSSISRLVEHQGPCSSLEFVAIMFGFAMNYYQMNLALALVGWFCTRTIVSNSILAHWYKRLTIELDWRTVWFIRLRGRSKQKPPDQTTNKKKQTRFSPTLFYLALTLALLSSAFISKTIIFDKWSFAIQGRVVRTLPARRTYKHVFEVKLNRMQMRNSTNHALNNTNAKDMDIKKGLESKYNGLLLFKAICYEVAKAFCNRAAAARISNRRSSLTLIFHLVTQRAINSTEPPKQRINRNEILIVESSERTVIVESLRRLIVVSTQKQTSETDKQQNPAYSALDCGLGPPHVPYKSLPMGTWTTANTLGSIVSSITGYDRKQISREEASVEWQHAQCKHLRLYSHSPAHAGNVAMKLNPKGLVSLQYHVVYDDISTVPHMRQGTMPKNWEQLVRNSSELATDANYDLTHTWFIGDVDPPEDEDCSPGTETLQASLDVNAPAATDAMATSEMSNSGGSPNVPMSKTSNGNIVENVSTDKDHQTFSQTLGRDTQLNEGAKAHDPPLHEGGINPLGTYEWPSSYLFDTSKRSELSTTGSNFAADGDNELVMISSRMLQESKIKNLPQSNDEIASSTIYPGANPVQVNLVGCRMNLKLKKLHALRRHLQQTSGALSFPENSSFCLDSLARHSNQASHIRIASHTLYFIRLLLYKLLQFCPRTRIAFVCEGECRYGGTARAIECRYGGTAPAMLNPQSPVDCCIYHSKLLRFGAEIACVCEGDIECYVSSRAETICKQFCHIVQHRHALSDNSNPPKPPPDASRFYQRDRVECSRLPLLQINLTNQSGSTNIIVTNSLVSLTQKFEPIIAGHQQIANNVRDMTISHSATPQPSKSINLSVVPRDAQNMMCTTKINGTHDQTQQPTKTRDRRRADDVLRNSDASFDGRGDAKCNERT